jgi:hypothetical protein
MDVAELISTAGATARLQPSRLCHWADGWADADAHQHRVRQSRMPSRFNAVFYASAIVTAQRIDGGSAWASDPDNPQPASGNADG